MRILAGGSWDGCPTLRMGAPPLLTQVLTWTSLGFFLHGKMVTSMNKRGHSMVDSCVME